jgi:hypothetical protein
LAGHADLGPGSGTADGPATTHHRAFLIYEDMLDGGADGYTLKLILKWLKKLLRRVIDVFISEFTPMTTLGSAS